MAHRKERDFSAGEEVTKATLNSLTSALQPLEIKL